MLNQFHLSEILLAAAPRKEFFFVVIVIPREFPFVSRNEDKNGAFTMNSPRWDGTRTRRTRNVFQCLAQIIFLGIQYIAFKYINLGFTQMLKIITPIHNSSFLRVLPKQKAGMPRNKKE